MSTDDFELLLTREGDARPIRNLWPLYLHDIYPIANVLSNSLVLSVGD